MHAGGNIVWNLGMQVFAADTCYFCRHQFILKTEVEPRRARRARGRTKSYLRKWNRFLGEGAISGNPLSRVSRDFALRAKTRKILRDLRVLRGDMSFSGSHLLAFTMPFEE